MSLHVVIGLCSLGWVLLWRVAWLTLCLGVVCLWFGCGLICSCCLVCVIVYCGVLDCFLWLGWLFIVVRDVFAWLVLMFVIVGYVGGVDYCAACC